MGSIAFTDDPKHTWAKTGWARRQILDDTVYQYPEDSEMSRRFNNAKDVDGLMVFLLPPELAARFTNAIGEVARGILSGTIHSGVAERHRGHEETVVQYREALRELLEAIPTRGTPSLGMS